MRKKSFDKWYSGLDIEDKKQVIFKKACFYLSRREYSSYELKDKLVKKYGSDSEELIDGTLKYLEEKGWQSDSRFTEAFIRSKVRKGIGVSRIQRELRQKGIDKFDQEELKQEHDFEAIAIEQVMKKYRKDLNKWEEMDYDSKQKLKMKIHRFLAYRGLPFLKTETIVAKLENIG
jgi:regulatory protein